MTVVEILFLCLISCILGWSVGVVLYRRSVVKDGWFLYKFFKYTIKKGKEYDPFEYNLD